MFKRSIMQEAEKIGSQTYGTYVMEYGTDKRTAENRIVSKDFLRENEVIHKSRGKRQ